METKEDLLKSFGIFISEGYLVDSEQCQFDDEIEGVISHIFNFCSCGNPYNNVKVIKEALEFCKEHKAFEYSDESELKTFVLYFLDSHELTEHGGSVYGSWLSDKGYDLLDLINIYDNN